MTEALIHPLLAMVGVLAVVFSGPMLAVFLLTRRKEKVRALRRSAIGEKLLRSPGHALREQIEDRSLDMIGLLGLLMAIPASVMSLVLVHLLLSPRLSALVITLAGSIVAVASVAWILRALMRHGRALDNLRAGLDAEMAVGQELDQLMRRGAYVFHDIPGEKFNIDHVVAAREGVFVVETKGYTKRLPKEGKVNAKVIYDGQRLAFPHFTTRDPVDQAERNAQWIGRWLSAATGDSVATVPVVALPGWLVDLQGRGAVRVYSGANLAGLLDKPRATPLTAEQLQRVAHQLEQRCRNVEPTYSRKPAD